MSESNNYSQNLAVTLATMGFVISSSAKLLSKSRLNPFAAVIDEKIKKIHPHLGRSLLEQAKEDVQFLADVEALQTKTGMDFDNIYTVAGLVKKKGEEPYDHIYIYFDGYKNTPPQYFYGLHNLIAKNVTTWEEVHSGSN